MPVSIATNRDPFRGVAPPRSCSVEEEGLRTPQVRVLAALMPAVPDDPLSEWPLCSRAVLGVRAGYTAISGSITRALNGIHPGSSSGDPHPGLLARGYVEEVPIDVEGVVEVNYRATAAGVRAYAAHVATNGDQLPAVKDAATCTNDRYAQ